MLISFAISLALLDPLLSHQAFRPRPVDRGLIHLTVGRTVPLRLATRERIAAAAVDKEGVLRISPVLDDPTTVLITGLAPGVARITLTGAGGRTEVRHAGGLP